MGAVARRLERPVAKIRTKEDLRPYQIRGARFLLSKRYCALFIDMGLGKTIMVLTAIARLLRAKRITRVLIVAPLRVVYTVWRQEARLWQHTRGLKFSVVHGNHNEKVKALQKPAHIYLINVEGLRWLDDVYGKKNKLPFDMLVVDESSMFKKVKTVRFTIMRRRVRDFTRRVAMTGTPTPNGLHEVWPQVFIADRGYHLGRTYTIFKEDYFDPGGYLNKKLVPKDGAHETIIESTSNIVMRLDAADWLKLPKLLEPPIWVDLPPNARAVYDELEEEMFYAFEETGTFVDNPHAAALRNRCAQICGGAIYAEHEATQAKVWQHIHDAKMDAAEELVDELQGEPPILIYRFRHEAIRLRRKFPHFAIIGKSDIRKPNENEVMRIVSDWNKGRIQGIIAHPGSVGHGLNLQHGGRHLIWFSMTESLELYLQMIKRLHRSGQEKTVLNYVMLARDTVDEVIFSDINIKNAQQRRTNDAYREQTFSRYMQVKRQGGELLVPDGMGGYVPILHQGKEGYT
jgi:SNF2 family DNA or RNA helicase